MKRGVRVSSKDGRRFKGIPPVGLSPRARRGKLESVMLYALWPSLFLLVLVMAARQTGGGDFAEAEAAGLAVGSVQGGEALEAQQQHQGQVAARPAEGGKQEREVQLLEQSLKQQETKAEAQQLEGRQEQEAQQGAAGAQKAITQQQQGAKAAQQTVMAQQQQATQQDVQQRQQQRQQQASVLSSVAAYASRDAQGDQMKFHFGFHNVRLTRKELQFFPPTGFKQPEEHWVDFISGNTTSPLPPTMIVVKGEVKNTAWYYLPVNYSSSPPGAGPLDCKGWVNKTAYLMQVRFSHNIWHTWNEGIASVFQTLRELGDLPLVEVDAASNVREVTEGMGKGCPVVFDLAANASRPATSCPSKSGVVTTKRCSPNAQSWCRPGVWSYNKAQAPMIVTYDPKTLANPWAHIYSAMTNDIRDFSSLEGWCFRNLVIGKSHTLNYYAPYNTSLPLGKVAQAERVEASGVFKAFATTSQQQWVKRQEAKQPGAAKFKGYDEPAAERLRRGIGPESLALAETILPFEPPPPSVAQPAEELFRRWMQLLKDTRAGRVSPQAAGQIEPEDVKAQQRAFEAPSPTVPKEDPPLESPRPVVTYMSRRSPDLRRGLMNEHDLLKYILSRYNVTLRVTTLQEPLVEVMALLKHTDVLIGMHGAGWTNGLFLKQGAAAVQLYPYGWQLPDGHAIRGHNYREIVLGNRAKYSEWYNPHPHYAFFREEDFFKRIREQYKVEYHPHPLPTDVHPTGSWPGNHWIYLATYADMASLGPVLDEAMRRAGIPPMNPTQRQGVVQAQQGAAGQAQQGVTVQRAAAQVQQGAVAQGAVGQAEQGLAVQRAATQAQQVAAGQAQQPAAKQGPQQVQQAGQAQLVQVGAQQHQVT